jgi:hypothetical protein
VVVFADAAKLADGHRDQAALSHAGEDEFVQRFLARDDLPHVHPKTTSYTMLPDGYRAINAAF